MLRFVLTGELGYAIASPAQTVIAVLSERITPCGLVCSDWVKCAVRDRTVAASIGQHLSPGDAVRIEGEIEPRRREICGLVFYDVVFVARNIAKLIAPAADISVEGHVQ